MATNLDELFAVDSDTEENGIWIELTDEIGFKVRAYSAKKVIDLREELTKPYQALLRVGGEIPEAKNEDIALRVIAGAVIADWKGIRKPVAAGSEEGAVGDLIPYSADAAYAELKRMKKLAEFIVGTSTDRKLYRESLREDGSKN